MELPCPVCGLENSSKFPDVPCCFCCSSCVTFLEKMKKCNNDLFMYRLLHENSRHLDLVHWRKNPKSHTGNGTYQGPFAFTLTMSPDDDLSVDDMIKAVRKLMSQKSCPVKYYAWYLEYGDMESQTHPHIHGMYETESQGRIEAKHFKRAWKIWDETVRHGAGFRGGYHRPVRSEENYSNYIKKHNLEHDSCLPI